MQTNQAPRILPERDHWYERAFGPYVAKRVPPPDFQNSPRIYSLIRAGNLYLSLSDAIALALENNLDIEVQRFWLPIAASDLLRAKGGAVSLRGIILDVTDLPPGIGGPATPLLNAAASGALPTFTVPAGIAELAAVTPPTPSGINIIGAQNFSAGPPVPQFDPAITGNLQWMHQSTPEISSFASGTPVLTGNSISGNMGISQGFSTGTQIGLSYTADRQSTSAVNTRLEPYTTSSLGLTVTQPLLRGFSRAVNRRFIRIARNNEKTSSLVFRQQAIATVSDVITLYDDLVSLIQDVRVKEETLAVAQQLYENNRISVQQGTLAPVELTRAEAGIAAAQQDLVNSRGFELQEELILKTVLSKRGTTDPALRAARLIPTTALEVPAQEPVRITEDLVAEAYRSRPELEEARLQIQNSHISLEGSRNELLPQLDFVATAQNSALVGRTNQLASTTTNFGLPLSVINQGFIGGAGTSLSQIFSFRYPTYAVGIQLNLPLRNRIAQGDVIRDELQLRIWDVQYQQLQNQVRLQVEAALIALTQARDAYDAAVQARRLQEQSLAIEQERFQTGLSTTFLVMQYQSFVAQARSTEVATRGVYAKARIALERAMGTTLETHDVTVEEAYRGQIAHPPR
jgi:outer membrane protein